VVGARIAIAATNTNQRDKLSGKKTLHHIQRSFHAAI
jgi:hypothetical protein